MQNSYFRVQLSYFRLHPSYFRLHFQQLPKAEEAYYIRVFGHGKKWDLSLKTIYRHIYSKIFAGMLLFIRILQEQRKPKQGGGVH